MYDTFHGLNFVILPRPKMEHTFLSLSLAPYSFTR